MEARTALLQDETETLLRPGSVMRGKTSAFAVYASFVVTEFNNLAHSESASPLIGRGQDLRNIIQRQIQSNDDAKESVWRHPTDSYEAVFELDRLNLRLMNLEQLKLRAFALLERYRSMFSGEELARITRVVHGIDTETPVAEQALRAQTDEVLASMHWYLLFSRARDRRIYELMKLAIFLLMMLTILALGCMIVKVVGETGSKAGEVASFLVFLVMGGLGAATSVSWRLQALLVAPPTLPETHLTDLGGLKYGGQGVFVSVGCGIVFSFILYMLFVGALVTSPLFPVISTPDLHEKIGLSLATFFSNTGPATGADYAKLLVWLFLSGFAEKFVPDILDRIRKNAHPRKQSNE